MGPSGGGCAVLVTGCSSGIGHHAAHALARRGWRVLATCRAEADCKRLRAQGLESFALDYASPASVARGAEEALERTEGRIEAVFNNGAYAIPGAVEDLPREALRAILETNLLGPHDLTRHLIPAMRAAGRGRIVNCSSVLGLVALPWRGAYNASKFALEGLTDTLRLELRGSGLHVSLIEPGPIATPFRRNSVPHFERWIDWRGSALSARYEAELRPRLYAAPPRPGASASRRPSPRAWSTRWKPPAPARVTASRRRPPSPRPCAASRPPACATHSSRGAEASGRRDRPSDARRREGASRLGRGADRGWRESTDARGAVRGAPEAGGPAAGPARGMRRDALDRADRRAAPWTQGRARA